MKPGFHLTRNGSRTVWVEYGPEEYRALWGGNEEDYFDYLAGVLESYKELSEVCPDSWLVRVPFDLEDYSAWAREHPGEAAGSDAHLVWAVEVARSSERLAALRERHRHKCSVPSRPPFQRPPVSRFGF
ncbi:hypothetical protein J2Z49_003001 [Desulfofundulus luciae]|uniref:Uncharacterized protein n=1 Tax=Desulfofundulus luciae TaxID=74702 RepID=A0ABU0B577_9FIRM|nr:hypothetical protein [Desulfofundulus luciae]MDQ0287867.1 hypothetical protein [Desulfofundulus luciae]